MSASLSLTHTLSFFIHSHTHIHSRTLPRLSSFKQTRHRGPRWKMDGRIWLSILTPAVQNGRRPTPISLLDCSMDGTVHCGVADHDSMKLLAMAIVADGKKGVCPPTAAETCQTCFASLLLSFSFSLSVAVSLFLSLSLVCTGVLRLLRENIPRSCCLLGYTSDANSRHLFKNYAMHTNTTDMLREMALIALLCHARSLPQHS